MLVRFFRVWVVSLLVVAVSSLVLVPLVAAQSAGVVWSSVGDGIDGVGSDGAGWSVSLSADGSRVAVGYPLNAAVGRDAGEVRVFERAGGGWELVGGVIPGVAVGDKFGRSVSLSADGSRVAVGAVDHRVAGLSDGGVAAGQVQVFDLNAAETAWTAVGGDLNGLASSDGFGVSVSLSGDGSRIAVGASSHDPVVAGVRVVGAGRVEVFELVGTPGVWTLVGDGIDGTSSSQITGTAVSLSDDGSRLAVTSWGSDGVRLFDFDSSGAAWVPVGAVVDGVDEVRQGRNAVLSGDGSHVAVGDPGIGSTASGSVQVFARVGTPAVWTRVGAVLDGAAASDRFGFSVSLSLEGSHVAVGASRHDLVGETAGETVVDAGQVQVFEQLGSDWVPVGSGINGGGSGGQFGFSVSLSANARNVAAGAPSFSGASGDRGGRVRVLSGDSAPINSGLAFTSPEEFSVAEGNAEVATVVASDPDAGDTVSYRVTGGDDRGSVGVDSVTGALAFWYAPDFEFPGDVGVNNVYEVLVTATAGGQSVTQSITVTVTDVNEVPVFTSPEEFSVKEGNNEVATVVASDPDAGDTVSYRVTGGADQALFAFDAVTGALTFTTAADFETPADADIDNVYEIQVTATAGGQSVTQSITVTVTKENTPTSASVSRPEGAIGAAIFTALEPENGDTVSYTVSGGADQALFVIDATTGLLTFTMATDFETPADADADNAYEVLVTATTTAGEHLITWATTINVTNVNELPVFTSPEEFSVAEGHTEVGILSAADPDAGDRVTFGLSGGADQALFALDAVTGAVTFIAAPDFERPADTGGNNRYQIEITADSNWQWVTQLVTVTVTNENEGPVFTSPRHVSVEEGNTDVATVAASDTDGDTVTYALSGGDDQALFALDTVTGVLTFTTAPYFGTPIDAGTNNDYEIQVTATAGEHSLTQDITVLITLEDTPTSQREFSVAEGNTQIGDLRFYGPLGGKNKFHYSVAGGPDRALIAINVYTGAVTFTTTPDFENPHDADRDNVYEVKLTATTSTERISLAATLRITVRDVNEAPVLTSLDRFTVAENNTEVATVTASDPDPGDTITFTLGGADHEPFTIDATSGALTFTTAPDFETPSDADRDNVYEIQVTATAGEPWGTPSVTQSVTVTVTNENDNSPEVSSSAEVLVVQGITEVTTVLGTDADGDTVTFAVSGGADQALFAIDATTGALTFTTAPNFGTPTDTNTDNDYEVQVTVTARQQSTTQDITVTVTETSIPTSYLWLSVAENRTEVATLGVVGSADDNAFTFAVSGGADQALFAIDATTGALTFTTAPDFEAPTDTDTNNRYQVRITAVGGGWTLAGVITVTVTNTTR